MCTDFLIFLYNFYNYYFVSYNYYFLCINYVKSVFYGCKIACNLYGGIIYK